MTDMRFSDFLAKRMRPLSPFEWRDNPDGSRSTELLATTEMPQGWVNVPTLWSRDGEYMELPAEDAARTAYMFSRMAGGQLPTFPNEKGASAAARYASKKGGHSYVSRMFQPP